MPLNIAPPVLVRRAKILSKFVSVQLVVQALGLACGILLVRTMDQQQYAYFTIANSMQATMNMLANMGIGMSLSAIGGKVWQDRYRFGQLINTALQLRYYLAMISITVITPILIWMLIRSGASLFYAILVTFAALVGLSFELTSGVLLVVPRLHSQIDRVQNLELISVISRLILLGVAYLTSLNAAVAIATASIILGLRRFILVRWASEKLDTKAPVNEEYRKSILATVKNVFPNSIFFCAQGQLNIFLISIFGSAENVAEVGVLGRLAVIFMLIQSVMNTIILPSFAKCQSIHTLRRRYFQILGVFLTIGAIIIGFAAIFPREIIWIFGNNYSHLQSEILLMVCLTVFTSFVGIMSSLNYSKSWVEHVWIEIPIRLILQAILLTILDISTVRGILLLSLLSNISPFMVNAMLTYRGLKKQECIN
ncbi:MAG: hypothetical protein WA919_09860 [Coleofasciculaceae cyanobacterium]